MELFLLSQEMECTIWLKCWGKMIFYELRWADDGWVMLGGPTRWDTLSFSSSQGTVKGTRRGSLWWCLPTWPLEPPVEWLAPSRTQLSIKNNDFCLLLRQQDILERFSSHGRHVLCATSAAEEGINVTTCQFVVRYSVTYTGKANLIFAAKS